MPNLVIVAANVKQVPNYGSTQNAVWGAAVTAGQGVYQDSNDNAWYPTDADSATTPGNASRFGIALSSGAAGQTGAIAIGPRSRVELGAGVMTAGDVIILDGVSAGQMKRAADLLAGEFLNVVGYAVSDSILEMDPAVTGIQKA